MRNKAVRLVACVFVLSVLAGITLPQRAAANIQRWEASACDHAVYATVEMTQVTDQPPSMSYVAVNQSGTLNIISSTVQINSPNNHMLYRYFAYLDTAAPIGSAIQINKDGGNAGQVIVGGGCGNLGRIAGMAYVDLNANGVRDGNEPPLYNAWFKVTGGGAWFVCGWVGGDATYGVTVKPNTYYVMPVAPPGYRTTTPKITVHVVDMNYSAVGTDMGFVKDPTAKGDACDQYNPPRP